MPELYVCIAIVNKNALQFGKIDAHLPILAILLAIQLLYAYYRHTYIHIYTEVLHVII